MRNAVPPRRVARHRLMLHRPPLHRGPAYPARRAGGEPARTSDLILALLAVTLLGALALMAAASLMGRAVAP